MANDDRPIIIRRARLATPKHHSGAWKIAYADFVTAMMAFFLLMWLLGSTTKGDLQGIAQYFQTPLSVAMAGGSGSGDATSVIKGGGQDLSRQAGQVKRGEVAMQRRSDMHAAREELERQERARLEEIKSRVQAAISANPALVAFGNQIKLDMTREGLRIQIVDERNRPMFDTGKAVLKDYTRAILHEIGVVLNGVDHKISLSGHTDAAPYAGGNRGYSNWELSAERANASRRELIASGLEETKVIRVVGLASSMPFDAADPLQPANRRISIIVLTRQAESELLSADRAVDAPDAAQAAATLAPAP